MTRDNEPTIGTVDSANPTDRPNFVQPPVTSCKICNCDTTGWCSLGISDHIDGHFYDINKNLPVRNDTNDARLYRYHNMKFNEYTKYGKCLVLAGLFNSEFPKEPGASAVDWRDVSTISRLRSLMMIAIMSENISGVAAERHEIRRIAGYLFRDEHWLQSLCNQLADDIQ